MTYVDWGYCTEEDTYIYSEIVNPVIAARIPKATEEELWVIGMV